MLKPPYLPAPSIDPSYSIHPTSPQPSVSLRTGASVDPTMLRKRDEAAVKHNAFPSRPGHPSGMTHWQTHLHVETWVRNTTYAKHVWADVHVFGHDGALVSSETCAFEYERPAGDGGDVFRLNAVVYEGATVTPGSVSLRPDVRVVQFRLYCELDGQLFTDGLLHHCTLESDVVSH